jgi:hypothetical protein
MVALVALTANAKQNFPIANSIAAPRATSFFLRGDRVTHLGDRVLHTAVTRRFGGQMYDPRKSNEDQFDQSISVA